MPHFGLCTHCCRFLVTRPFSGFHDIHTGSVHVLLLVSLDYQSAPLFFVMQHATPLTAGNVSFPWLLMQFRVRV